MPMIQVSVDSQNGTGPETIDLDLDLETLTMREAVRLEEALGSDVLDELMAGGAMKAAERPSTIRALIYTKLKTVRPDVELDGFDLDLGALTVALTAEDAAPKGSAPA